MENWLMKYGWEKEIDLEGILERINEPLPLHLEVIGLAVVNTDQVEACLQIDLDWISNDMASMDVMQDIKGDASTAYEECRILKQETGQ
jgi:hypothetical protein